MHDCVYAELGHPEKCVLRRTPSGTPIEVEEAMREERGAVALRAFFARHGRRCPACNRKVDEKTSAGGRRKRWHAACL
jgi:hypothetical protein